MSEGNKPFGITFEGQEFLFPAIGDWVLSDTTDGRSVKVVAVQVQGVQVHSLLGLCAAVRDSEDNRYLVPPSCLHKSATEVLLGASRRAASIIAIAEDSSVMEEIDRLIQAAKEDEPA